MLLLRAAERWRDGAFSFAAGKPSRLRGLDLAPKGHDKSAQGNALGGKTPPWKNGQFQPPSCPERAAQLNDHAISKSLVKTRFGMESGRCQAARRSRVMNGLSGIEGVLFRPYRAGTWVAAEFLPGRCPGLICGSPFGAEDQGATKLGLTLQRQRGASFESE